MWQRTATGERVNLRAQKTGFAAAVLYTSSMLSHEEKSQHLFGFS